MEGLLQHYETDYVRNKTFHIIQIVIHLVSFNITNPKSLKVPFKTQPIALGYYLQGPTCLVSLQNPTAIKERHHLPSPQKSHDISLHTNAFDSYLDRNYTLLHSRSQTHNYSIDPSYHTLLGGSYVYDPILLIT